MFQRSVDLDPPAQHSHGVVRKAWETKANAKRKAQCRAIPAQWRIIDFGRTLPPNLKNVTSVPERFLSGVETLTSETPVPSLLESLRTGVWSAEEVVTAYCHRAAIAHQLVNCPTEVSFTDAIKTAQELDHLSATTGQLKGPLYGLSVSFMDRFRVAGTDTAAGYIAWLGKPEISRSESLLVTVMRNLGAVPFCKTNVPMSMMLAETANNISGRTLNPYALHLSSGSPAGGEVCPNDAGATTDENQGKVPC